MTTLRLCLFTAATVLAGPVAAADPFEFKDGDRVVLLGSTLIEREQKYGYWEYILTVRNADKNVTFRNLGWSGDTVFGDARNGFDESPKGFERLVSLTKELKPTVVVVCYGHNESFEGLAGVAKFAAGLEKLLDAIAPTSARVVLMSPTPFENAGPVRDADERNKTLTLYRDAIKGVAEKRKVAFADLFEWSLRRRLSLYGDGAGMFPAPITDNGLHLTSAGYYEMSGAFLDGRGMGSTGRSSALQQYWEVRNGFEVDNSVTATGATAKPIKGDTLRLEVTPDHSSPPPTPPHPPRRGMNGMWWMYPSAGRLAVQGVPNGRYTVKVNGQTVYTGEAGALVFRATLYEPLPGIHDRAETLRAKIIDKNQLFFHRWRPQNETYLFGFRKHEQGKNAREVAEFDPLVAAAEKEIAGLRKPKPVVIEFGPAK